MQVDGLEALRLAQLHRQLTVVDQPVLPQIKVLKERKGSAKMHISATGSPHPESPSMADPKYQVELLTLTVQMPSS